MKSWLLPAVAAAGVFVAWVGSGTAEEAATQPTTQPATQPAVKTMMDNGDFEGSPAGPESKGKLPKGWMVKNGDLALAEIVAESGPGSPGKQCLKFNANEKSLISGMYSTYMALDPTKPLKVSGWVKGSGHKELPQGGYLAVLWFNEKKEAIPINANKLNYTYILGAYKEDKWREQSTLFKPAGEKKEAYKQDDIPPDAAFITIGVMSLGYPLPVWFDDVIATQDLGK